MPATNNEIEKRLWAAADQLYANSNLRPSEFSTPVLGLIFLRYTGYKFTDAGAKLAKVKRGGGRRKIGKLDYRQWVSFIFQRKSGSLKFRNFQKELILPRLLSMLN